MNSTRTTIAGIAAILAAVFSAASAILDGDPGTVPAWEAVAAAITAGVGLMLARDNDKRSEDVGAGKRRRF